MNTHKESQFNNLIEADRHSPNFGGPVSTPLPLGDESVQILTDVSERAVSFGGRFKRAMSPIFSVCPVCRGYDLERSWCDHCNKSGLVTDQSND